MQLLLSRNRVVLSAIFSIVGLANLTAGFVHTTRSLPNIRPPSSAAIFSTAPQSSEQQEDDTDIQWELFRKHHAKGSWKGIWTTYDYIGDVVDETIASVNYNVLQEEVIEQTHTIVVGAKRSDCETCFDSNELKTFPVAMHSPANFLQKSRFASNSMVIGPSVLRSGAMATELVLARGDGRVRVIFQHAPVWQQGVEPGSCPPQGLKLFRTMVAREALRPTPPTPEAESKDPPTPGNPIFNRPVPPFNWHKKWSGTSWTWGPSTGNRGWSIDEIEESDAWQGIATIEQWNLRLPGGIHIQTPRVITAGQAGICRLAWLPDDETLLRVEAGVAALEPILTEDEDSMVGFHPPSLVSLRCDVTKKIGELENASLLNRVKDENELAKPEPDKAVQNNSDSSDTSEKDDGDGKSGLGAVRDAMQL